MGCDNKEIFLLIGADFYWNIVQDKIVWGYDPTVMESKIGYLLSGPLSSLQFEAADGEVLHVRLELMAAVTDACLCKLVLSSLKHLHFKVVMWSGSQIVLHWLFSKKKLHPFVANRVCKIHELLPGVTCSTQDNSADLVTEDFPLSP